MRVICDILLYTGKWSPRRRSGLRSQVEHVLFQICHHHGNSRIHSLELETRDSISDGPRVVIHVVATWWRDDPDLFADLVCEALLYHLRPEYESQIEVECCEEADSEAAFWWQRASGDRDDDYDEDDVR